VPATARAIAARVVFATVVIGQTALLIRGYGDPHRRFAFQPFNESSTWRAEIVRVLPDGRRVSVRDGWHGYRWEELVRARGLGRPWGKQQAAYGVDATLDFLQRALDWVATHTPRDRETVRLEAEVIHERNRGGERRTTLTSRDRPEARAP
jgi:hypothetical protein